MDILKHIMPAVAVLIIIVCAAIKRKEIKKMFSARPIISVILLLIGIAVVLLIGLFASRFIMKI